MSLFGASVCSVPDMTPGPAKAPGHHCRIRVDELSAFCRLRTKRLPAAKVEYIDAGRKADRNTAFVVLKFEATPTFFINDGMVGGAVSFEELDQTIRSALKRQIPRVPSRLAWKAAALAALQRS